MCFVLDSTSGSVTTIHDGLAMEEVINEDLVDHDNDAAIAAALAANAVIPQQPSRRREGDRHQTPQQRTTTHGGAGRGRDGGTGRGRGG